MVRPYHTVSMSQLVWSFLNDQIGVPEIQGSFRLIRNSIILSFIFSSCSDASSAQSEPSWFPCAFFFRLF